MCLAFPMKIERIDRDMAEVSAGQIKTRVSIRLIERPKKGDYVLVHAGMAIERINRAKAQELITLLNELDQKIERS